MLWEDGECCCKAFRWLHLTNQSEARSLGEGGTLFPSRLGTIEIGRASEGQLLGAKGINLLTASLRSSTFCGFKARSMKPLCFKSRYGRSSLKRRILSRETSIVDQDPLVACNLVKTVVNPGTLSVTRCHTETQIVPRSLAIKNHHASQKQKATTWGGRTDLTRRTPPSP